MVSGRGGADQGVLVVFGSLGGDRSRATNDTTDSLGWLPPGANNMIIPHTHQRITSPPKSITHPLPLHPLLDCPLQPPQQQDSQAVKLVKVKSVESRTGSTGNVTQVSKAG
jgi:hypothetical protein